MTTLAQTVVVLDELASTYRAELNEGDPERWHRQLRHFNIEDVQAALEAITSTTREFMPVPGVFAQAVREQIQTRSGAREAVSCEVCDGGRWVAGTPLTDGNVVHETVQPCGACNRATLERAREIQAEQAAIRARTPHGASTLLPYRLADQLRHAREELHKNDETAS